MPVPRGSACAMLFREIRRPHGAAPAPRADSTASAYVLPAGPRRPAQPGRAPRRFDHVFGMFRTAAGAVRRLDVILATYDERAFCILGRATRCCSG